MIIDYIQNQYGLCYIHLFIKAAIIYIKYIINVCCTYLQWGMLVTRWTSKDKSDNWYGMNKLLMHTNIANV